MIFRKYDDFRIGVSFGLSLMAVELSSPRDDASFQLMTVAFSSLTTKINGATSFLLTKTRP